jgi:cytochrome c oxidase subunit 2
LSTHPSPAHRGRRRTRARSGLVLALSGLLLAGCDAREAYEGSLSFGVPEPISDRAENIYELYLGSNAAALVVGVFVWALIFFAAFRYRKRSDDLPRQVRYNLPIEILYTAVPFVIIAVRFYYTVVSQNFVNELTTEDDGGVEVALEQEGDSDAVAASSGSEVNIGVVGFQWNWQFNYIDADVSVIGETNAPAQLVLPTDRTIRFIETSPDVIHSFFVPEFLFKRDVIPGRANQFELTLKKEGEFIGRCAEFCGEKHAFMNFSVKVVSPQEYDDYIDGLQADPNAEVLVPSAAGSAQ